MIGLYLEGSFKAGFGKLINPKLTQSSSPNVGDFPIDPAIGRVSCALTLIVARNKGLTSIWKRRLPGIVFQPDPNKDEFEAFSKGGTKRKADVVMKVVDVLVAKTESLEGG